MPETPATARFRVEYGGNGGIVGIASPRLTWVVEGADAWLQQSYELRSDGEVIEVDSGESVFVPWPFRPLASRERATVQVRVTSTDGRQTDWSAPLVVETGLLEASDWQAVFVGPAQTAPPEDDEPCPFLRHEFHVDGPVASARLYVTALGVYEPYLNGSVVGDQVLAPNWTSYHHRLRYQIFDVTDLIREGANAVGAILGDGWYRGRLNDGTGPWRNARNLYGHALALLAQLELALENGTRQLVVSDESWRATTGPLLASSIYDGEQYDARLELGGWADAGYDDSEWQPVTIVDHPLETLVVPTDPPIRRTEELAVASVSDSRSGKLILDFGQNLVGRLRISVYGAAGDTITLDHAEAVAGGELEPMTNMGAQARDVYTLKGGGTETWEPRFTFHGFRYVQIDGWPGSFAPDSVRAIVLHTDFERTGWFECSDPLVNKLHENLAWTIRGNFLGVPTDCPQRAERLGWTGDFQLISPSASTLFDISGPTASWLRDLAADQSPEGRVPHVVPNIIPFSVPDDFPREWGEWVVASFLTSSAAWGDAAVIVPWVIYQRFGDRELLAGQFESMRKYVDYVAGLAGEKRLWQGSFSFGDWLSPWAPADRPDLGGTPVELFATAYFARSADIVMRAAGVLGHEEEARHYGALVDEIRAGFCDEFMDGAGNVTAATTTAQALVLAYSLAVTDEQRRRAGERLIKLVRAAGDRATTGLTGTAIICDALCDAGDLDAAYRLLLQREFPSWLYPVTAGATTIWEAWDGVLPDGQILGTSLNHYALGSVVDWLYRVVAGLEAVEPGYRKVRFRPRAGGDLTHASARHVTPYGVASIAWSRQDGALAVDVEVPANTTADLLLPDGQEERDVQSGRYSWLIELN